MQNIQDILILSTKDFYYFVNIKDILYCQSKNSYTLFFIKSKQPITVSTSIKIVEQKLSNKQFIRPHQSYLVNANHVQALIRTTGNKMILSNGIEIPISSRKRKEILQLLSIK